MTTHAWPLPISIAPLMADAKRRMRKRRLLIVVVAVLMGGAAGGIALALNSSGAVQPAAACPATGGFYAVPDDPAHPPAGDSGAGSWGWMGRHRRVKVGDRMRLNGRLWQVAGIVTLPGVEPVGRPFYVSPLVGDTATATTPGIMCGRLTFRPVS